MPLGERFLDVFLARQQPVHRDVQVVLIGVLDAQPFAYRAVHRLLIEASCGREL
jgi:hypothetical protein